MFFHYLFYVYYIWYIALVLRLICVLLLFTIIFFSQKLCLAPFKFRNFFFFLFMFFVFRRTLYHGWNVLITLCTYTQLFNLIFYIFKYFSSYQKPYSFVIYTWLSAAFTHLFLISLCFALCFVTLLHTLLLRLHFKQVALMSIAQAIPAILNLL